MEGGGPQVHPYRFRLWGMAASPGGGNTVALVSKYNTVYPSRAPRCRLMFSGAPITEGEQQPLRPHLQGLTTEAKMWEWMYGRGDEVPAVTTQNEDPSLSTAALKELFRKVKENQTCCFCDSGVQDDGTESRCLNGHSFGKHQTVLFPNYDQQLTFSAICSSSGLAILAPGISRVCAVCQRRCLQESELKRLLEQHSEDSSSLDSLALTCGGCGGKFVA